MSRHLPARWRGYEADRRRAAIVSAADILWGEMATRTFDTKWLDAVRSVLALAYPDSADGIIRCATEQDCSLADAAALIHQGAT